MFPVGAIVAAMVAARYVLAKGGKGGKGARPLSHVDFDQFLRVVFTYGGLVPRVLVSCVCVPLGWPRAAWWIEMRIGLRPIPREAQPRAYLSAARALARRPGGRMPRAAATMLELGTAGAAGEALFALTRGDVATARAIAFGVASMGDAAADSRAVVVAREVLALEATLRRDWEQVVEATMPRRRGRRARLLRAIALRQLGRPRAPGRFWLCVAWLMAPQRRATRPLLRSALAVPVPKSLRPTGGGQAAVRVASEATGDLRAVGAVAAAVLAPPLASSAAAFAAATAAVDDLAASATLASELAARAAARATSSRPLDVAAVTAQLSTYQAQLTASYAAISKIQSLNLASYLR